MIKIIRNRFFIKLMNKVKISIPLLLSVCKTIIIFDLQLMNDIYVHKFANYFMIEIKIFNFYRLFVVY